jgi:hypothetical protein
MAKLKLDKDKLKQLLKQKVEVVGLGAAGVIAFLLLVIGLGAAFGTGSPATAIVKDNQSLRSQLNSTAGAPETDDKKPDEKPAAVTRIGWPDTPLSAYPTSAWYDPAASGDPKKRNPTVRGLEVLAQDGKGLLTQVTAYSGGVFTYRVDLRNNKIAAIRRPEDDANKSPGQPEQFVRTEHLALVEGVFPYKEQIKDYLKALRIEHVEELAQQGLTPVFAGLNVYRGEIKPDGKVDWKPVYLVDKEGKVTMSAAVERLLKESIYDLTRIEQYAQYLPPEGGDTPFPKPIVDKYPPLKIEGLTLNEVEPPPEVTPGGNKVPAPGGVGIDVPGSTMKGRLPGKGAPPGMTPPGMQNNPKDEGSGGKLWQAPLSAYSKAFAERVKGKVNPFSVFGVFPEAAPEDGKQGFPSALPGNVPMGGMPYPPGMMPPGMGKKKGFGGGLSPMSPPTPGGAGTLEGGPKTAESPDGLPDKVVLRFVDAGLEPGKAYQYYVQVLLKNPNFGKKKEVAYPSLAEKKILDNGPWVLTPPVFVPPDYAFYFVNTDPKNLVSKKVKLGNDTTQIQTWQLPVQIHQLVDDSTPTDPTDRGHRIGDWVVAERLLLARGDLIARPRVQIEAPYWNPAENQFVLGSRMATAKGKRTKEVPTIPVDFGLPDDASPVLVDFWGGKATEANVEALVLTADGRLAVRSSHEDADAESDIGRERLRRYETWRARLESIRNAAQPSNGPALGPGGIPLPGEERRPKGPGGPG